MADSVKYTKEHEWIRIEGGNVAVIGITEFAQDALGDVVFVDLPEAGESFGAGEEFGTVESVKTVSELNMPSEAEILEVNATLADHPEAVNEDPYGKGWICVIEMDNASELDGLMDAEEYGKFAEENK